MTVAGPQPGGGTGQVAVPAAAASAAPALERAGALPRTVGWRSAVVVAVGGALLVTVSLGPMAAEIGAVVAPVWLVAALVGALHCLLLAELARLFPGRAGGTATYAHVAFGERAPLLAALSSWGYWFAWTPGIAVTLILAATYFRDTIWAGVGVLPLALAAAVVLYAVNALGLRLTMRVAVVAGAMAVVPLAAVLLGAFTQPGLLDTGALTPMAVPGDDWLAAGTWALLAKWAFVVVWTAYGAEMASTVIAETREQGGRAWRVMGVAAVVGIVGFGALPFVMVALLGVDGLTEDPTVAFLPVADELFGQAGRTLVGVMLSAALLLGALAFIVASSRTVFQMTRDGYMPRLFGIVNARGVPVGSIGWDAAVIIALLLIFGTDVLDVVAAANVGYLVVFTILPVAFVVLARGPVSDRLSPRGRRLVPLACVLAAFNLVLLVVGGAQWPKELLTGAAIMLMIIPIALVRRLQDRRAGALRLPRFPAGMPEERPDAAVLDAGVPADAPVR